MEWKEASVGMRVLFPIGRFGAVSGAQEIPATITGVGKKKGRGGQDTPCFVKLDEGRRVVCRVSWLEVLESQAKPPGLF